MPRYTLRVGGSRVPLARTNEPISSRLLDRGTPQTVTDSGGSVKQYTWHGQELDRGELRKVKQIREKGGVVAFLFEAKATMRFGTGAELQSENDDLQTWLDDNFGNVDLLTLDLGADATWYPYGLGETVETRGGDFSHIEPVEPWTMLPQTNAHGDVVLWEQLTKGEHEPRPFDPEDIGSIVLNKASGRDRVGVSEVLRSEEEITSYKQNQEAVNKAIEIAGFPHHIWTVGSEGRTPVDDTDLRRVRNLIDNMDGDTQFVVGPDVAHDKITAADFAFEDVTKRDLRILTTAVGLPLEMAGYGREGMGSGSETDLIMSLLALQNEVARRRYEVQFVREFVEPVVRDYSPFDADAEPIDMHIPAFLDDTSELADLIEKVGEYMTNEQIVDKLDLPPIEDDDISEAYRSPQQIEEAEEGDTQPEGPFGGVFSDAARDAVDTELEARDLGDGEFRLDNGHVLRGEGAEGTSHYLSDGTIYCETADTEYDGSLVENGLDCPECGQNVIEGDDIGPLPRCNSCASVTLSAAESPMCLSCKRGLSDDTTRSLIDDTTPDFDAHYLRLLEGHAWHPDTDRALIADAGVPEAVQARLREAILGGALFSDFDTIPSDDLAALRQEFVDMLDAEGWTTDSLTEQLQDFEPSLSDAEAERIARTETASVVNTAREEAYEDRGLADARFKWVSQADDRRTDACEWLTEQTADGVTMERLKELIEEAPSHDADMADDLARPDNYVVHPNERSTWVRHVE